MSKPPPTHGLHLPAKPRLCQETVRDPCGWVARVVDIAMLLHGLLRAKSLIETGYHQHQTFSYTDDRLMITCILYSVQGGGGWHSMFVNKTGFL